MNTRKRTKLPLTGALNGPDSPLDSLRDPQGSRVDHTTQPQPNTSASPDHNPNPLPNTETMHPSPGPSTFPLSPLSPTPPRELPEWIEQALNTTQYLWNFVDSNIRPVDSSPKAADATGKLNEIRQTLDKISRSIGHALSGHSQPQAAPAPAPTDLILTSIQALANRIKAQEEALLCLAKPTSDKNNNSTKPTYSQVAANNRQQNSPAHPNLIHPQPYPPQTAPSNPN
jgi:hypothetical protein